MKQKLSWLIISLSVVAMIIAGCGGGGSDSLSAMPGITLTIGADVSPVPDADINALPVAKSVSKSVLIQQPLDAKAIISITDFATGKEIASGIIGSDGVGNVRLTPGLCVAVIVTGTRDGKTYRLSGIIPSVPRTDSTYIVRPESTIAAEALAGKYYKKNSAIDEETYTEVYRVAMNCLHSNGNEDSDFSVGGDFITSGAFGTNAIKTSDLADVLAAVPETLANNNLVNAKNIVRRVKEIGTPLSSLFMDERQGVGMIVMSMADAMEGFDASDITAKYGMLGNRLDDLILPVLRNKWTYNGSSHMFTTVFSTENMGKGYVYDDETEVITPNSSYNTSGQITVVRIDESATLKLSAKKTSSGWTFEQTSNSDAAMSYVVKSSTITDPEIDPNPSVTGSFSVKDEYITTPITFNGSISAIGTRDHYTSLSYSGKFTAPELQVDGLVSVSGTYGDHDNFLPTNITVSGTSGGNAIIHAEASEATFALSGAISFKGKTLTEHGVTRLFPTESHLVGSLALTRNDYHFSITSGDINAAFTTVQENDGDIALVPTAFSVKNSGLSFGNGTLDLTTDGSIAAKCTYLTKPDGEVKVVPTMISLDGSYTDTASQQSFEGSIVATWDNPSLNATMMNSKGSLTINAQVTDGSYIPYLLDMKLALDGNKHVNCQINKLAFDVCNMNGAINGTLDDDGHLTTGDLTLSNSNNVTLSANYAAKAVTGKIVAGGEQVATIASRDDAKVVTITFTDDTVQEIPQ